MMTGSRCALRRSSPKFRLASFAVSVCIARLLAQSFKEYSLWCEVFKMIKSHDISELLEEMRTADQR
jgi:hypothetical protein